MPKIIAHEHNLHWFSSTKRAHSKHFCMMLYVAMFFYIQLGNFQLSSWNTFGKLVRKYAISFWADQRERDRARDRGFEDCWCKVCFLFFYLILATDEMVWGGIRRGRKTAIESKVNYMRATDTVIVYILSKWWKADDVILSSIHTALLDTHPMPRNICVCKNMLSI